MIKILVAECQQEVSSFNPKLSGLENFVLRQGNSILEYHRTGRHEMGGALGVFDPRPDVELVPTYSALLITPGGTLATADWTRLAHDFLAALRAAPAVDGAYFSMHGAIASERESDCTGYLLAEARKILGDDIPIVVSLDMHGILTDQTVKHSDAIVVNHTYPHVDFPETGARSARLLLKILAGDVQPVTAKVTLPCLVRGDELITSTGLFGQSIRQAQAVEAGPNGLSAGMFIGNPFTDVPELQSYSFVVTNNDPERAEREALRIAEGFWANHDKMQVPLVSLEEMARLTLANRQGTVGLVDAADAASSGASGDSNAILRQLMMAGYQGRVLVAIADEPATQQAFAAGVGGTITTTVGGTLDPQRFPPLTVTGQVRMLSDGQFRHETFGEGRAGPTAVLQVDNYTVIVTSRPANLRDRALFLAHGQDPKRFDAVVIKAPHCERHMYADWCALMVNVDAPGSTSANLRRLGHRRCPRPIAPLDGNVPFAPKAKLFQRAIRRQISS